MIDESLPGLARTPEQARRSAIVIGGGIAGMATAQILTKYFDHITIVERDSLPAEPRFRPGKPQGRHSHILLASGLRSLESIFPGITDELRKHGALDWDWGSDPRWYYYGGWRARHPTVVSTVLPSLPLLEWVLRQRLALEPRVQFVTECTVDGLLISGSTVSGVRAQRHRSGRGQRGIELSAALVVDASGRLSKAPEWLAQLGFPRPKETKIDAFWGYASRLYERPPEATARWRVLAIHPTPPESTRCGVILSIEGGLWHATLFGSNRDYPPDNDEGFLEFARGLAQPHVYEALRRARPVSGIYGYRYAENRLRHYHELPRYLEGFVVLGDAACLFNPIYGQGMSVALRGTMQLDLALAEQRARKKGNDLTGFSRRFQRRLVREYRVPWLVVTSEDRRYGTPTGGPAGGRLPLHIRLLQSYLERVVRLAARDQRAYSAFVRVFHLVASPLSLLHPLIVWKVLLGVLFPGRPAGRRAVSAAVSGVSFRPVPRSAMAPLDDGDGMPEHSVFSPVPDGDRISNSGEHSQSELRPVLHPHPLASASHAVTRRPESARSSRGSTSNPGARSGSPSDPGAQLEVTDPGSGSGSGSGSGPGPGDRDSDQSGPGAPPPAAKSQTGK